MYVCKCLLKQELWENAALYISQEYGFTPECIHICFLKWELPENAELHSSKENGFFPMSIQKWFLKLKLSSNADLQSSHGTLLYMFVGYKAKGQGQRARLYCHLNIWLHILVILFYPHVDWSV